MQFYSDVLTSEVLETLASLPSPPPNDWSPLLATLILHFLQHFRMDTIRTSFRLLLQLRPNPTLWAMLVSLIEKKLGLAGFPDLVQLDTRSGLSAASTLNEWLTRNGNPLQEYLFLSLSPSLKKNKKHNKKSKKNKTKKKLLHLRPNPTCGPCSFP